MTRGIVLVATLVAFSGTQNQTASVVVSEGTSMSVSITPDGRTLAIDLQGTVWTLPSTGGAAKAITDFYNDARHPTFSPDGKTIAFQGYRAGHTTSGPCRWMAPINAS